MKTFNKRVLLKKKTNKSKTNKKQEKITTTTTTKTDRRQNTFNLGCCFFPQQTDGENIKLILLILVYLRCLLLLWFTHWSWIQWRPGSLPWCLFSHQPAVASIRLASAILTSLLKSDALRPFTVEITSGWLTSIGRQTTADDSAASPFSRQFHQQQEPGVVKQTIWGRPPAVSVSGLIDFVNKNTCFDRTMATEEDGFRQRGDY